MRGNGGDPLWARLVASTPSSGRPGNAGGGRLRPPGIDDHGRISIESAPIHPDNLFDSGIAQSVPFVSALNRTRTSAVDISPDIFPIPSGGRADAVRSALAFRQSSWIPAPELAAELGISRRTLARWLLDVALEFPRPKIVNRRLYFERNSIEAWKAATAVKVAEAV
jgi:predicted DNA-binding transcriptional regulator AlpA